MFRLKKQYYGDWNNVEDVFESFFVGWDDKVRTKEGHEPPDNFPRHDQIIFAMNRGGGYEESCTVVFVENGKLMYVSASHCSCYGYEGQWDPDEVTWFQLWKMDPPDYDETSESYQAWQTTIGNNVIIPVDIVGEDDDGILCSRDVRGMRPETFFVLVPNTLITAMGAQGEQE